MHGIQCDEVEFQNCTSLVKYKYILVHTGIYWYVLVHTSKTQQTSFDHAPSFLLRLRVSAERLAWSSFTLCFCMAVSSTVRPPRRGFPWPKFHSQVLTSYTLHPRLPTVVKGNIVYFFCNAVRTWRDNNDGILHTPQTVRKGITL